MRLKIFFLIFCCVLLSDSLFAKVIISPFRPIIHVLESQSFESEIIIKDVDLDFKGVKASLKDQYELKDFPIQDWFVLEKDYYNFESGEVKVKYKIKLPENLKVELALSITFAMISDNPKFLNEVYTLPIYVRPPLKPRIKIKLGNPKIVENEKGQFLSVDIFNESDFHIRPVMELFDGDKVIKFFDDLPVLPNNARTFATVVLNQFKAGKKMKLVIKDQVFNFEKKYKIKFLNKKNELKVKL